MKLSAILICMCLLVGSHMVSGQQDSIQTKNKISFRDPVDGAFDVSSFLLEHNGVLPIIFPITEPAVGYGAGLAVLYFHNRKKNIKPMYHQMSQE